MESPGGSTSEASAPPDLDTVAWPMIDCKPEKEQVA